MRLVFLDRGLGSLAALRRQRGGDFSRAAGVAASALACGIVSWILPEAAISRKPFE